MEKTAAYIRVSTAEQKMHGLSLDAQEQKLVDYAESNNLNIVGWYRDEGVSGRKLIRKRPELQRMIEDAEKGMFSRIIFIKLDRFFRSVAEYHECMKRIGPVIWTATEERYDMSTANGRAFINMKLTINELEADQTGERIRLVNQYKVTAGRPLCGSQSMPFCYSVSDGDEKRIVKRNADAADAFFQHFDLYRSIRSSILFLKSEYGIQIWFDGAKHLLMNPMICGEYRGNPNYCEPYITREKYDEWQRFFDGKSKTRTQANVYLFSGLIRCPSCGNVLSGNPHFETRSKRRYNIYRCSRCWTFKACDFKLVIFESTFEKKMIEYLNLNLSSYDMTVCGVGSKHQRIDTDALKAELQRVSYMFEKGRISIEEYDRKYSDIEARLEYANKENEKIQMPKALNFQGNWIDAYNTLNKDAKSAFWRSAIKSIDIEWTKDSKNISAVYYL